MNSGPMLNGSEEYYVDDDGILTYDVALPLPATWPELPSETVEEQLSNLSRHNDVQRGPPARSPDPGPYDFHVEINSRHTNKKKYVYSQKLNRIYVDMDMDFPVQFAWRGPPELWVRAACVFADDDQAEKRVERCLSHFHSSVHPDAVVSRNVLHSSRPPGTAGTKYCGDPDLQDSWLSVLVALQKQGNEVSHAYRFTCKNSCASGINRRSILIIFTLEDGHGNVLGRQTVGARVCACPRRDMVKDEESEGVPRGKRRLAPCAPPAPPPTKVKRENTGDTVDLNLQLLSPAAAILGLEVMLKMELQVAEATRDPRFRDVIADLRHKLQELKAKYPEHAD